MGKIFGAEIGQLMVCAIAPDEFNRMQFGRRGRQLRQLDPSIRAFNIGTDAPTSMSGRPLPDDQPLAVQLPLQVAQEVNDLRRCDRAALEPEGELPHRDPGDRRQHLPREAPLQYGWLSLGRPGPDPVGPFAQARFVDEDARAACSGGVVL